VLGHPIDIPSLQGGPFQSDRLTFSSVLGQQRHMALNLPESRSVLSGQLRARGFAVVQPLSNATAASVFKVKESTDPDAVAWVAKVVSLSGMDAKARASAQQEVSLLRGLAAHPNLIAYRESFLDDSTGILYIVMSLAEDGDLRRVVTESQAVKRSLPEPIVLWWVRQTLEGLRHLHDQGVMHRDLKSSNIFLCDGRRRIRIGDFGISIVLESKSFASSCVGTPAYMAPEMMQNEKYDYHVDMWALGCICFELCTLSLPFSAGSLFDLVMLVVNKDPDWSLWHGYSPELLDVAKRLMRKKMKDRPTAEEMLEEPLFAPGGRGSQVASEDDWAIVTPMATLESAEEQCDPEKRTNGPSLSQLTTIDGSTEAQSSQGHASTLASPALVVNAWDDGKAQETLV